jgi:pimeloyl-ACP methyl ester carboxylesterase
VLLLHGGLSNADAFGMQTPAFAEHYRVLLPERRGHGHTADTDAPFTYPGMAEETIAFMEALDVGRAHLVGWSDGGNVALIVAGQRPDLVDKIVTIAANFDTKGYVDGFEESFKTDAGAAQMMRDDWVARSPDPPEHYDVIFEKTSAMWFGDWALSPADLARIAAPALVLTGDDDAIRLDHTVALYDALVNGQLAVVPGASHLSPVEKPDLVNGLILDFLASGPPAELLPIRRRPAPDGVGD